MAAPVAEQAREDVYVDLDGNGNQVSITIQHTRSNSKPPEVLLEGFDNKTV